MWNIKKNAPTEDWREHDDVLECITREKKQADHENFSHPMICLCFMLFIHQVHSDASYEQQHKRYPYDLLLAHTFLSELHICNSIYVTELVNKIIHRNSI